MVVSRLDEFEGPLLLQLRQFEHRFLDGVGDLSAIAVGQHAESDRRIAELSENIPQPPFPSNMSLIMPTSSSSRTSVSSASFNDGSASSGISEPTTTPTSLRANRSNKNEDTQNLEASLKLTFEEAMSK